MEEGTSLERRMAHLERTLMTYSTEMARMQGVLERNSEILDDVRSYLNKPTNWAEWIMASVTAATAVGAIIWAFWVQPLEIEVDKIKKELEHRSAYIVDHNRKLGVPVKPD